ncbi:uncharacterized protein LOC108101611 [Drosophila ficusphila]|uniref:uncharacterized protein LOC108101611 n=1 Tax=Drosophila ficusphila TaxID=30025 RepID=UPI0007E806FB|nr:uncharacterized protein LOC108101611 [Drosophila ficusphila]
MVGYRTLPILLVFGLFQTLQAKFVWSTGGASSLFVAIALPLDLPNKEVFLSYNFEASYDLPRTWKKKPPFLRHGNGTNDDSLLSNHHGHHQFDDFVYDDYYDDDQHSGHKHKHHHNKKKKKTKPKPGSAGKPSKNKPKHKHKKKHKPKPKPPPEEEGDDDYKDFFQGFPIDGMGDPVPRSLEKRSLLSRSKFYEILSHRFEMHGLGTGDRCLLRLICEANSYQLGDLNGVLGTLVHIMFSPTTSRYEALPNRYYIAELDGRKGNCGGYKSQCQYNVLDTITQPLKNKTEKL